MIHIRSAGLPYGTEAGKRLDLSKHNNQKLRHCTVSIESRRKIINMQNVYLTCERLCPSLTLPPCKVMNIVKMKQTLEQNECHVSTHFYRPRSCMGGLRLGITIHGGALLF